MKTFHDLVRNRQSDRAFTSQHVESEKLQRILETARLAPSACNAQPWKIVVVTDPEQRHQIADATSSKLLSMNHFTKQAPVQLVILEENANFTSKIGGWIGKKHYPLIDIGILASHICLAAADEGLGSCMIGWCDEKKVQKIIQAPKNKRVIMIILLGYSAQKLRNKKRKDISDIISENNY